MPVAGELFAVFMAKDIIGGIEKGVCAGGRIVFRTTRLWLPRGPGLIGTTTRIREP